MKSIQSSSQSSSMFDILFLKETNEKSIINSFSDSFAPRVFSLPNHSLRLFLLKFQKLKLFLFGFYLSYQTKSERELCKNKINYKLFNYKYTTAKTGTPERLCEGPGKKIFRAILANFMNRGARSPEA